MSLRARKHKFTGDTTSITSYDAEKTNLGSVIIQQTGTNPEDKYVGPAKVGVARPMEEVVTTLSVVVSSSTVVSGLNTSFTASMTGMKIGFGDTDPARITTWYTLGAWSSTTSIAITSGPTIGIYVPYVIVANIPGMYPHVIPFSSTIDWVFMIENLATATTGRRICLYEYNKTTSVYTWKGFINATLPNGVYANTIRGFRAIRYLHTDGTVTNSGTLLTGSGTTWQKDGIAKGARVGFGSTDPAQISPTNWRSVYSINSENKITHTKEDLPVFFNITSSSDGTKLAAVVNGGYIYTSTDSGATWSTNGNSSGSRTWWSITSSSDGTKLAAVVSSGSIYTSTDSGITWTSNGNSSGSRIWYGITSSSDGTKLAAVDGASGYVYTSTDSGVTWTTNGNSSGSRNWFSISSSADGTKLTAVIQSGYIYTSTNSGTTWSTNGDSSGSRDWSSVASSADGTKLAAVVNGGYIYTSTNSGVTWSTNGDSSGSRSWNFIASSADGTKLVAIEQNGYIYTSANSGTTWSTNGDSSGSRLWRSIISSSDGATLIANTNDEVFISTDAGVTWNLQTNLSVKNWLSIASSADGTKVIIGAYPGYIYYSSDSGVTWTQSNSISDDWRSMTCSTDGTKVIAGTFNPSGYIYYSSDSGATWTQSNSVLGAWVSITSSSDGTKVVAVDNNSGYIYYSSNSGATWTQSNSISAQWYYITSSSDGTKLAAAAYGGGYIYYSSDSGATWTQSNSVSADWYTITSSSDGTKVVALDYSPGYIYYSVDSGATWTQSNSVSARWQIVTCSSDGTKVVAAGDSGYIYYSGDSGATWTQSNSVSANWRSITSSSDGTKVVAGAFGYIYYSSDSGATWTQSNSVSADWYTITSSSDGTKVVAGAITTGSYIWYSTDSGATWSTEDKNLSASSSSYVIEELRFAITTTQATETWNGGLFLVKGVNYSDFVPTGTTIPAATFTDNEKALYKLSDAGNTGTGAWTTNNNSSGSRNWVSIASSADGTKLAAGADNGYIYTSTNSGVTWTTNGNSSGSRYWGGITSSADGTKLAAGDWNNGATGYIYTSTNSGVTWTTNSNSSGSRTWQSIISSSDGTKLAAVDYGGYIYTSTNSGVTWTTNSNSSGIKNWKSIASSYDGVKIVAGVFVGFIYYSTNSGVNWTQSNSVSGNWVSITSSSDGTKLAAVDNDGYIYYSTNSGVDWTQSNSILGSWQKITSSSDGTKLAAVNFGGYIYLSSDSGATWIQSNSISANWYSVTSSSDGTKIAAGIGTGYIYTFNTTGLPTNVASCGLTIAPEINKGLHYAYVPDGFGSAYMKIYRYNLRATGLVSDGKIVPTISYTTTGTVTVTDGVVTGSGTSFNANMIGMKIGFGFISPGLINTWYTIASYSSGTSITLDDLTVDVSGGTSYIIDTADVIVTGNALVAGTVQGTNNGRYGTLNHGPGKGVPSLYFVTSSRIYRSAISKIYAGNLDWISDNRPEIPPGGVNSYPATGALNGVEIIDAIDRLAVVSTGATAYRNYVTKYPEVSGDCFDHIWGVDDKQQDQIQTNGSAYISSGTVEVSGTGVTGTNTFFTSAMVGFRIGFGSTNPSSISTWYTIISYTSLTSITLSSTAGTISAGSEYVIDMNPGTVTHFNTGSQAIDIWSENGIAHVLKRGTTSLLNQLYSLPFSAHWTYAGTTNQRVITPIMYTPDCSKFRSVVVTDQDRLGTGEFAITPEPFRLYYRTKGIYDNSGEWTFLEKDEDLGGLSGSPRIQFMFEFVTIGWFCVPARIMSLTVLYDDTSSYTDSHYQPSMSKSDAVNKRFAWRFATGFGGTVPTLRVRLYDAQSGDLLMDDYTTNSKGTWNKLTDGGNTWSAYDTNDKINETTYISYTPASLGDNIKVRIVLTQ